MREVRWEYMFPDDLEAAFQETPVVYLPYGSANLTVLTVRWGWTELRPTGSVARQRVHTEALLRRRTTGTSTN